MWNRGIKGAHLTGEEVEALRGATTCPGHAGIEAAPGLDPGSPNRWRGPPPPSCWHWAELPVLCVPAVGQTSRMEDTHPKVLAADSPGKAQPSPSCSGNPRGTRSQESRASPHGLAGGPSLGLVPPWADPCLGPQVDQLKLKVSRLEEECTLLRRARGPLPGSEDKEKDKEPDGVDLVSELRAENQRLTASLQELQEGLPQV